MGLSAKEPTKFAAVIYCPEAITDKREFFLQQNISLNSVFPRKKYDSFLN